MESFNGKVRDECQRQRAVPCWKSGMAVRSGGEIMTATVPLALQESKKEDLPGSTEALSPTRNQQAPPAA